jgi:RNA polymerase sigma-70 factor (sigma-E family)
VANVGEAGNLSPGRYVSLRAQPEGGARVNPADDEAFEAFVRAHGTTLVRLAGALTGNPHVSEEVVQSALERVFLRWPRLDDPLAYSRQVVVNLCRDRGRGAGRRERVGLPRVDSAAPDVIALRDDRDQLVRAVRALPYRQRAVLVLRFWHDLTEQQAADALRIRAGTVKSQTSRALQRLRQLLDTSTTQVTGGRHDSP